MGAKALNPAVPLPRPRQGYAKTKVSSIFQPLAESILVDQPGDPIDYMVKYVAVLYCSFLAVSVWLGSPMLGLFPAPKLRVLYRRLSMSRIAANTSET